MQESQQTHELSHIIRNEIAHQNGVISFSTFMELALYHPTLGYYNTRAFDSTTKGDFLTAPEISPLFAQCFAAQCFPLLNHLGTNHILEIGAGTGRFAGDLLAALHALGFPPVQYTIYEISSSLRLQQEVHLKKFCPDSFQHISWVNQLPKIVNGIVIANEVLDALPAHCFRIDDPIMERGVAWENNAFIWQPYHPVTPALTQTVQFLRENYALPTGYESEINLQILPFLQSLTTALDKGVIFFADYGYGQSEYYHPERAHGTLSCFYKHKYHHDPLILPGLQDITTHVDFTRVITIAAELGCALSGYTSQSEFLLACGLLDLASKEEPRLSPIEQFKLHHAIKLLTLPTEMGERIKVMAISKNLEGFPLLGFSRTDRRRDL